MARGVQTFRPSFEDSGHCARSLKSAPTFGAQLRFPRHEALESSADYWWPTARTLRQTSSRSSPRLGNRVNRRQSRDEGWPPRCLGLRSAGAHMPGSCYRDQCLDPPAANKPRGRHLIARTVSSRTRVKLNNHSDVRRTHPQSSTQSAV